MPDILAALNAIEDFETNGSPTVAWKLDRAEVLLRLRTLVQTPEVLNQRGLNACGPAVFFRIWFARDPAAAATFACALLRDGYAPIGAMMVSPDDDDLRAVDYAQVRATVNAAHPGAMPEAADWMLLSALRDSENVFLDYLGQPYTVGDAAAGITLPSSLASWLSATALYQTVSNETNLIVGANQGRLLGLIPTSDIDVVLFLNARSLYNLNPAPPTTPAPGADLLSVPDHYVLMRSPFAQWADPGWLQIDCWSWGSNYSGWQGSALFFSNYFGVLVAQT